MITLEQLTLSGKPCSHDKYVYNDKGEVQYRTFTWNDSKCELCSITYEERKEQDAYEWFLWRAVIKKLNPKWEVVNKPDYSGKPTETNVNSAFVYDFDYVAIEPVQDADYEKIGEKEVVKYKKLVVVDQKTDGCSFLVKHYSCSDDYKTKTKSPETRELRIVSTRAPTNGPSHTEWFKVISWACEKDSKIQDYVLNASVREFAKTRTKNVALREKASTTAAIAKADKFGYREQLAVSDMILNERVREALRLAGIGLSKYFNFSSDSNQMYYKWTGSKTYLLTIRNDDTLDTTGRKLYDAIIDLFGQEAGDQYITNSTDDTLKRLSVCILGNITLGLIEQNDRVRLAAEKLIKKNEQAS